MYPCVLGSGRAVVQNLNSKSYPVPHPNMLSSKDTEVGTEDYLPS